MNIEQEIKDRIKIEARLINELNFDVMEALVSVAKYPCNTSWTAYKEIKKEREYHMKCLLDHHMRLQKERDNKVRK